jgi:hypothetical protein
MNIRSVELRSLRIKLLVLNIKFGTNNKVRIFLMISISF